MCCPSDLVGQRNEISCDFERRPISGSVVPDKGQGEVGTRVGPMRPKGDDVINIKIKADPRQLSDQT